MNLEEEVKQLVFQVPAPPNELLPGGVTDEAIAAFEMRTRLAVPASLRAWLRLINGPCIGPGGLLGIAPERRSLDIEEVLNSYPRWRENGWIPVAGDGCGDYYVLNTTESGGPVYFIDTASDADHLAYAVGSNLWRFLWFLLKEEMGTEGWLFSKGYVISCDTDIVKCVAAPLPWDAE
jgi:hypothetical protein